MLFFTPEPDRPWCNRYKEFIVTFWRGLVVVIVPLAILPIAVPNGERYHWCAYCLVLMGIFWVTECIPLAVTSFFPIVIFPLTNVMGTSQTCKCYMNDSVMMFVGSLLLATAVEQSGLHMRMAYCAIRTIGYSHLRLLGAMCFVTTFVSMWITNTAATTMMVPINFAVLKVFEEQKIIKMYDYTPEGDKFASDVTSCYFCAATYSATIGGIGTLVGTGTNLVFKGLFQNTYPSAPEHLSFPLFSAFAIPYMIFLEIFMYLYMIIYYFGFLRPSSPQAKLRKIPLNAKLAAKRAIDANWKKLGGLTFWETMVILLFGGAMISFFCRSPQIFKGWADRLHSYFGVEDDKFIRDSALAFFVVFLMLLLPSTLNFFKNCSAKYNEELPKGPIPSVLQWTPMNISVAWSFMFLLGGGFALSTAARVTDLNGMIGKQLKQLKILPNPLILLIIIIVTCFVTNFASNVAVCNVFSPIAMQLAKEIDKNPLWYNLAAGFTASFCFMIPVGTPGNLVVQSAANIPTRKMIIAGAGPTVTTIILTWVFLFAYAPIIWPSLKEKPSWA